MQHKPAIKLFTLATVTAALFTGCSTLPKNQTAEQTFKQSIKKSSEYNSYNFRVDQQLHLKEISAAEKKQAEQILNSNKLLTTQKGEHRSLAECDADLDKNLDKNVDTRVEEKATKDYLACVESATSAKNTTKPRSSALPFSKREIREIKEAMTPERIQAIEKYWLQPFTVSLEGAVSGREAQINYTISYKPKNLNISVEFPFLVNFDEKSITVDPALALPIAGVIFPEKIGTQWEGKGVKFTLPEEFAKEIPSDLLIRTFNKSILKSYADLPKELFSYKDRSQLSKKYHAKSVVSLKLDSAKQISLLEDFLMNWITEIDAEVQANPDLIKDTKFFNKGLDSAKQLMLSKPFTQGVLLGENEMLMGEYEGTFFINKHNDMKTILSKQTYNMLTNILNAELSSNSTMTISNINKAKFTFKPTAENIIDGNKLIKEGFKGLKK